jgi:ABC-type branched-subunit amino acid transport system substrate-binding protein
MLWHCRDADISELSPTLPALGLRTPSLVTAGSALRRRVAVPVLALFLLGGALTACAPNQSTMKVGLMYPTSGSQGAQGTEEKQGAELAATADAL